MYQSNSGYGQYAPTSAYRQTVVQPQTPIMPLQQQLMLKGRPVSSLEEARATTIDLSPQKMKKVLSHEITHAAMFSYNISLSIEQEELLADLVATYGQEIICITNKIFHRITE